MLVTQQSVLRRFWYAVMPLSKLADGAQPFTLLGEHIVLWLRSDGKPAALRDRCCHRTARLSKGTVQGDHIVCGWHGWTYNSAGIFVRVPQAPEIQIPAGACVPAHHCQGKFGYAWVAPDDPLLPLLDAEEETRGYRRVHQFDETWHTGALRMMENSFDTAHFAFVHAGTFGQGDQPKPEKFALNETEYGFEAEVVVTINNPPQSHRITGSQQPTTQRHFSTSGTCHFCASWASTAPAASSTPSSLAPRPLTTGASSSSSGCAATTAKKTVRPRYSMNKTPRSCWKINGSWKPWMRMPQWACRAATNKAWPATDPVC